MPKSLPRFLLCVDVGWCESVKGIGALETPAGLKRVMQASQ